MQDDKSVDVGAVIPEQYLVAYASDNVCELQSHSIEVLYVSRSGDFSTERSIVDLSSASRSES